MHGGFGFWSRRLVSSLGGTIVVAAVLLLISASRDAVGGIRPVVPPRAIVARIQRIRDCVATPGRAWRLDRDACGTLAGWRSTQNRSRLWRFSGQLRCATSAASFPTTSLVDRPPEVGEDASARRFFESTQWFSSRRSRPWAIAPWYPPTVSAAPRLRQWHDPALEHLFRVEHFCVSATGGMSGFMPQLARYAGRDETRTVFTSSAHFAMYLGSVQRLSLPPSRYDERPVVFFPVASQTKHNLGHTFHRVLSLIGVFRAAENGGAGDSVPLLLLVVEPGGVSEGTLPPALNLLIELLGVPWAAVTLAGSGYVQSRFWQDPEDRPAPSRARKDVPTRSARMCFRRGVAWQNCFRCDSNSTSESESYSFGLWVDPSPSRHRLLYEYDRKLTHCLGLSLGVPTHPLPAVWFSVRTRSRGLLDFGLMADLIERLLTGVVRLVRFRELWHHDRNDYLREVRDSDIFVGPHGAEFADVVALRPGSYVIELAWPYFWCPQEWGCAFRTFAALRNLTHWVVGSEHP